MGKRYIVVGCKSWNRDVFDDCIGSYPGEWHFIGSKDAFTEQAVRTIDPSMIFVLHWSWKIPGTITKAYTCVNFHMTDLPYGRGGSPLQNLIVRGHKETVLTAHKMVGEMDAGPVYLKEPLSLEGTADEIFRRATKVAARMMKRIITERPEPKPQQGPVTVFRRRRLEDSELEGIDNIETIYDYIRMLDGEEYPPAFIEKDGWRYEFTNASLRDGSVEAHVRIRRSPRMHP